MKKILNVKVLAAKLPLAFYDCNIIIKNNNSNRITTTTTTTTYNNISNKYSQSFIPKFYPVKVISKIY